MEDGWLVVKFDRGQVQDLLTPGIQELTVDGTIDGINVTGSDLVSVIDKGKGKNYVILLRL